MTINENSLQGKERGHEQKDIHTFSCGVKEHTIANSTSKNGRVEECQYISWTVLFKTPTYSRVIIKNRERHKGETTNNHMLQKKQDS